MFVVIFYTLGKSVPLPRYQIAIFLWSRSKYLVDCCQAEGLPCTNAAPHFLSDPQSIKKSQGDHLKPQLPLDFGQKNSKKPSALNTRWKGQKPNTTQEGGVEAK